MLIRRQGEINWQRPEVEAYENERALQTLLEQSPGLLPGASEPMAMAAEVTLPDGISADLVGVDATGQITLVECKLRANPEIRRTVVGQLFAYAAGLWKLPYDSFDAAFRARTKTALADAAAALAAPDSARPWDGESFRAAVAANLEAGRFRLVIAVDVITDELKRTVEFLNTHTAPEVQVLSLELRYIAHAGVEIVQPSVYGEESVRAKIAKQAAFWSKEQVLAALGERSRAGAEAVGRLCQFVELRGGRITGGRGDYPSLAAALPAAGGRVVTCWRCYVYTSGPRLEFSFGEMRGKVADAALAALAARLRTIQGVDSVLTGMEASGYRKFPAVLVDPMITQPDAVAAIESALEAVMALA